MLVHHEFNLLNEPGSELKGLAIGAREIGRVGVDAVEELESVVDGARPPAYQDTHGGQFIFNLMIGYGHGT